MRIWFADTLRSGRIPAFVIAFGCAVLIYGFLYSAEYNVREVRVEGAELGDPVEIAEKTGAYDVSVFEIDPDQVAARIAVLPYVDSVVVHVEWPSEVRVRVVERKPVVAWQLGQDIYLVDMHGVVVDVASSTELPRVQSDDSTLAVGSQIGPERVAAANAVIDSIGSEFDQISWTTDTGLTVRLQDKRTVIFGDHERLPAKLAVFKVVLASIDDAWTVLDLREPDRPYYK